MNDEPLFTERPEVQASSHQVAEGGTARNPILQMGKWSSKEKGLAQCRPAGERQSWEQAPGPA